MGYTDLIVRVNIDMLGPLYVVPGPIVLCSIQSTYMVNTQVVGTSKHVASPPTVLSVVPWVYPSAQPGPQG